MEAATGAEVAAVRADAARVVGNEFVKHRFWICFEGEFSSGPEVSIGHEKTFFPRSAVEHFTELSEYIGGSAGKCSAF